MKPFNLEEAKEGKPVVTRDGRKARIICFDAKDDNYPIVALVTNKDNTIETVFSYTVDGMLYDTSEAFSVDLFMSTEKKEAWINIYKNTTMLIKHDTEEAAKNAAKANCNVNYITTIRIEWEE